MAEPKTTHEIALSRAVEKGFINEAKELLSLNSINLNDERYYDYYLVMKALDNNHIDLAKLLVEKGFRVYKTSKTSKEKTIIHAAIQLGDEDLIRTLLAKGASPDILTFDEQNKTPLHLAMDKYQDCIIELFLSQFDSKTLDKYCMLHYAVEKNYLKIVPELIAKGLSLNKKDENNSTPFCIALKYKHFKILNMLLSDYSVKNIDPKNYDDIAPVYVAIIHGNLKVFKKYIDSGLPINIPVTSCTDTWPCLKDWPSEPGFTLLHFAVKHVKLKVVEFLLRKGADILVQSENGSSPLHVAFETKEKGLWKTWQDFHNMNTIIDSILNTSTKLEANPINKHGLSYFHIACSRDKPAVVEHFLKLGAAINQQVKPECHLYKEFSPLHFAAKFRCKKTVELLLKNEADIKQRDFKGMTALHIAAKESCLDVVSLLLQYGAEIASVDCDGNTPTHWAFKNKSYKIMDLLLPALNTKSNLQNNEGMSVFHIACTRNNVKVVKSFIEDGMCLDTCVPTKSHVDESINEVDWSGYSPLHFAVSHNRSKIVELLLDNGANVGIKDSKGLTALHLSCQYTQEMFSEYTEKFLCGLSKRQKITHQFQPLTDVVSVDEKYVKFGIFSKFKNIYDRKFYFSPNRKDHLKIMSLLLDYESDINCTDNDGNASILYAYAAVTKVKSALKNDLNCLEGLWDEITECLSEELYERRKLIVNDLLKLDVNLDECYKNCSILHAITPDHDKQSKEMMKLFLRKGAGVDAANEGTLPPLLQAIVDGRTSLISILLDYGANVDCIDPKSNATPLLIATSSRKLFDCSVVKILLDNGANPDARQSDGKTALHNLASLPHVSTVDLSIASLIRAGADVDSQDPEGRTALHLACERRNEGALRTLLARGANVNVEDDEGRTVYCYLYEKHLEDLDEDETLPEDVSEMMTALQEHLVKLNVVGLPVSETVLSSSLELDDVEPLDYEDEVELKEECQSEVQLLRDTRIHGGCTLFDAMFKMNENALSRLVKFRTFRRIYVVQAREIRNTYPQYGYLIEVKYQAGVDRAKLLPTAKLLLNELAGMHVPDTCSENVFKYFTNVELRESSGILRGLLDLKVENRGDVQLKSSGTNKRRKID